MHHRAEDAPPRLADLLEDVWQRLSRGVADRRAPARHPAFATVGARAGEPAGEARIVVLRGADRAAGALTIHTDAASPKVEELRAAPRATLLVWDQKARLQIRLRVHVAVRAGLDEEWARVPDPSRRAYGGAPEPGTSIPSPDAYAPAADRARFAVLEARIDEIDVLRLDEGRHVRARFRRDDAWAGDWLAP